MVKAAQDAISLPVAAGLGPSGQRPRRAKTDSEGLSMMEK